MAGGRSGAFVALSSVMRTTTTEAADSVAGSIGALKRTVIGAVVEKPSRLLIAAAFGRKGVLGSRSVPSVLPKK